MGEGVPGRAAAALEGVLTLFSSRSPEGKHAANGSLWREREGGRERLGGLEQVFFLLWEVAEHILGNHFMLLGSGALFGFSLVVLIVW